MPEINRQSVTPHRQDAVGPAGTPLSSDTPPRPVGLPPADVDLPAALGPDAVVTLAYITAGLHRRWTEGFAARSTAFRAALAACLELLEEAGEAVSVAALRWYQRRRIGEAGSIRMVVTTLNASSLPA